MEGGGDWWQAVPRRPTLPKSLVRVPPIVPKKRRARWSAEEARRVIGEQMSSGLSVSKFAERKGLDAERLYRWKRILAEGTVTTPAFVEVRTADIARHDRQIEITLRSGHRLFFADSVDPSALGWLLQLLE